ncbi:hypothetical protein MBLNU459_g4417t1 [Dothideomycetes sp. NU459]
MAVKLPRRPRLPFRIPFFRIFYSTTYTSLFTFVLIMLAITPATMIYSAFEANAYQYIFEIGGVYILTALLTLFIYSSRLYTNRSVLAAVGKSWIPVEDGEVSRNVRKMIKACLGRSAAIAWESRPRDLQRELAHIESDQSAQEEKPARVHVGAIVKVDPESPPWGHVAHPGWSSPSQADTLVAPHIQFRTVIQELPNLVEAKAVSLAPPDPAFTPLNPGDPALADARVVDLLQRRPNDDLRNYLTHLSSLGVVDPPYAGEEFLSRYDHARFCTLPISETEFETLMACFARLLDAMQHLPPDTITMARDNAADNSESDRRSLASSRATSIASSIAASQSHLRPPVSRAGSRMPSYASARSWHSARSSSPPSPAPTTSQPRTLPTQTTHTRKSFYGTPSQGSLTSVLRRPASQGTFGSVGSVLRPARSRQSDRASSNSGSSGSSAARSVIRLTPSPGPGRLPYEWADHGG